jgi:hypothetical protein
MSKQEWLKEILTGLERQTGTTGIRFGTQTELMRVLVYRDIKHFKKEFLQQVEPVTGKKYSVRDFVDANYGRKLL